MKPWKVIAFHSDEQLYIDCGKRLKDSLIKLNIQHEIIPVKWRGSWQATSELKPTIILRALERYIENVVYLDIDAVVQKYPKLFDTIEDDVAVHYKDGKELLASTVYFKNCDKTKELIETWIETFPKADGRMREQKCLDYVLKRSKCSVYKLPAPYALIFDTMKKQGPPVIEQFQASRRAKH
jgi:hypothetical protein